MDMEMITDLMEAVMILCFGLSWPISIRKSWVSRTAKGKSLFFECYLDRLCIRYRSQIHATRHGRRDQLAVLSCMVLLFSKYS